MQRSFKLLWMIRASPRQCVRQAYTGGHSIVPFMFSTYSRHCESIWPHGLDNRYDDNERCPRALVCLHTFCHTCLQTLARPVAVNTGGHAIRCELRTANTLCSLDLSYFGVHVSTMNKSDGRTTHHCCTHRHFRTHARHAHTPRHQAKYTLSVMIRTLPMYCMMDMD